MPSHLPRRRGAPRLPLLWPWLGVAGDQALQHIDEALGRALAADALHADARAFTEEEELVGEEFGVREPGLAAERDDLLAVQALVLLDHTPRRMVLVRQLCRGIDEGAAALRQVELELTVMAQPGEELCLRIAGISLGILVPRGVELGRQPAQAFRDQ